MRLRAIPRPSQPVLARSVDVQPLLHAAVAPPAPSFGLKDVASAFGYRYRHPDMDGLAVAAEYMACVRQRRPIPKRLLSYNRDDLLSLSHLIECVTQICDGDGA